MRNKKQNKRIAVPALFLVLLCIVSIAGACVQTAFARTRIDTDKSCSLRIRTGSGWDELQTADIPVRLYRVADVSEDGVYTAEKLFAGVDVAGVNAETDAAEWEALSAAAAAVVDEKKPEAAAEFTVTNGEGVSDALPTGLYLVYAQAVKTAQYEYTFTPYLISLPDNTYRTDGKDAWVYENVEVSLKPEQEPRYGALSLTKRLDVCDQTLGDAFFVFSVEAVKNGETVYSNVLSLSFSEAGEKSVTVEGLPAGAQVTVTEVYAGASYALTSAESVSVEIIADETEEVFFSNTYDERLTYGTGVVNHFDYDGDGYSWEQKDSNE